MQGWVDTVAADGLKGLEGRGLRRKMVDGRRLWKTEACMRVFGLQRACPGPDAYTEKISQGPRLTNLADPWALQKQKMKQSPRPGQGCRSVQLRSNLHRLGGGLFIFLGSSHLWKYLSTDIIEQRVQSWHMARNIVFTKYLGKVTKNK